MKSLKKILSIAVLLSLGLLISGCEKKATNETTEAIQAEPAVEAQPSTKEKTVLPTEKVANKKVVVAATGTKFDPSISPSQLPENAWACVMGGKVHYAKMEKGDGKCEICKMNLSQQNTGAKPKNGNHGEEGHGDHKH